MDMCYDGTLVMPSSYELMNHDEMIDSNGGWCIENKWWGYNIYLTHAERQAFTSGQAIAGFMASGIVAAAIGAVATILWNYDDGHGVRIRMTGLKFQSVITGVFPLTSKQEKNIASLNKII